MKTTPTTGKELALEEERKRKKLNPYKWRNRFLFLFFGIFGFLLVSITSIFFPDTWAPLIKNMVTTWGVPAIFLYGGPALAFWAGSRMKEEPDPTLQAVARVFGSLTTMAVIMSVFSYVLATGMVGTAGEWLWTNPWFIMLSGWLIFADVVFGIFLTWELVPKLWAKIFFKFGYDTYPPPPHVDRIFHKLRLYLSYEYNEELARFRKGERELPPEPEEETESEEVIDTEELVHELPPDAIQALERADKVIYGGDEE